MPPSKAKPGSGMLPSSTSWVGDLAGTSIEAGSGVSELLGVRASAEARAGTMQKKMSAFTVGGGCVVSS